MVSFMSLAIHERLVSGTVGPAGGKEFSPKRALLKASVYKLMMTEAARNHIACQHKTSSPGEATPSQATQTVCVPKPFLCGPLNLHTVKLSGLKCGCSGANKNLLGLLLALLVRVFPVDPLCATVLMDMDNARAHH